MDLVYCAGGNERTLRMALDAGWLIGVRSDRASYGLPVQFVDIHYRAPDFARHLRRVKLERPKYAVVPDLSEDICDLADIKRAMRQADELTNYCEVPLIVPKRSDQLPHIPAWYAIAYSVPSSYGGAAFGPWLLRGRRVHLLGGSPSVQRCIYRYLRGVVDVASLDGNMAQKVGLSKLNYWDGRVWIKAPRGSDPYACFARSLVTIRKMWAYELAA